MSWILKPTETFKRRYKRKRRGLRRKVDDALRFLVRNHDPKIFCRLKYGRLAGLYGYDLDDDNRILLKFIDENQEIQLLRVCDHRHVYGSV